MGRICCFILVLSCFCGIGSLQAQDAVYSQFYMSPTLINPAFAGNTVGPYVALNYRNQWPSINKAYTTYSLSYDQQWQKNSGIGIYVNSDNSGNGAIVSTKLTGVYSYKVELKRKTFLKGAIEGGFGQTRLDWDQLVFFDSLDPQFGSTSPGGVQILSGEIPKDNLSRAYLDVGAGLMLYDPFWYVGFSFKHINSPTIDFVVDETGRKGQLPSRWTLHGGLQIPLSSNKNSGSSFVSPHILVSKQADFWQVTGGAYVDVENIFGGIWYRQGGLNEDAIIASVGVKANMFKIGYSYDYTISQLTIGTGGTHEIGVSMVFGRKKGKNFPYSDCFGMFR